MALINCKGCGHRISTMAKSCPKCGCGNSGEAPSLALQAPTAAGAGAVAQGASAQGASAQGASAQGASAPVQQSARQEQNAEWYFVSQAGRSGPITLDSLLQLAADGYLGDATPVWKAGMPDWVALSHYQDADEDASPPEPPAFAAVSSPKWQIWALATAPVWGTVLQVIATEIWVGLTNKHLGYYCQLWWLIVVANLGASYLDFTALKKTGQDAARIGRGMFLLIPAYIYQRDGMLKGPRIRFPLWIASLLLSLTTCLYLNGVYARLVIR